MKKLAVVIVTALAGHLQTSASAIHARLHQRRGVCDYGTMPGMVDPRPRLGGF